MTGESVQFCTSCLSTALVFLPRGYSVKNVVWLCKQIAHETAWGTSNSIKQDLNAWGMNCVSLRKNEQSGCRETESGEVLGVYSSLWNSCRDRYMWDDYWGIDDFKKSEDYPQKVSVRYHTSSSYAAAVSGVDTGRVQRVLLTWAAIVPLELLLVFKIFKG